MRTVEEQVKTSPMFEQLRIDAAEYVMEVRGSVKLSEFKTWRNDRYKSTVFTDEALSAALAHGNDIFVSLMPKPVSDDDFNHRPGGR